MKDNAAALALGMSLALVACGGGGSGGPITVNGTVVDGTGAPVSGANVVLDNDAATLVTTGADGAFSYEKVSPPYTLTIRHGTDVFEYRGLRRASPQIVTDSDGLVHGAPISGTVTGPAYPLANTQGIVLGTTTGLLVPFAAASPSNGAYGTNVAWAGASSTTTDLVAMQFEVTGSLITSYPKIAKRTGVSLQDGVGQSGLDVDLGAGTAVGTGSTTLTYGVGPYTAYARASYLMIDAGGAHFFFGAVGSSIPSGTSLLLPDGGGTFAVSGQDAHGNTATRIGTAVLGGTTTLDLPATTVLASSLPADGATGVSRTPTLSWTPVSGADFYLVTVSASGLRYSFCLPGDSASLVVPDYTALGLPLAAGADYDWYVTAARWRGVSPDALTKPGSAGISMLSLYQATDMDLYGSATSTFTTAP